MSGTLDVSTRRYGGRRDRRSCDRLREAGRHYVLPGPFSAEDCILAETTTLDPAVVGFLGFIETPTFGVLMPNLRVAQVVVDPTLRRGDGDAVFLTLLRKMYAGFSELRKGYLLTKIGVEASDSRRLLEADGWIATSFADGSDWLPYAWFAADHYGGPVQA